MRIIQGTLKRQREREKLKIKDKNVWVKKIEEEKEKKFQAIQCDGLSKSDNY